MATPAVGTRKDAPPLVLPDIPEKFGEDNGEFYSRYDALAEESDNNMVNKLKEQLDGHLLFAGLFAGVNSTFLALTLPLLSASPADDTNALLRENNAILLQLASNRNDSLPTASPLPSESFSVSGRVLSANILFSISLTLALMSALFAVLGRQWLIDYRSHSGSGADEHRRERMNCHLGARRWQLEWLLGDMIPTVLQIGLILFGISLTIYLSTLHPTLTMVVGAFMGAGIGFLVCTAIFAVWDPFCPFQTPLSRLITLSTSGAFDLTRELTYRAVMIGFYLISILSVTVGLPVIWLGSAVLVLVKRRQWTPELPRKAVDTASERMQRTAELFYRTLGRAHQHRPLRPKGVTHTGLSGEAVRRVICDSTDYATLITCITNILAIQDRKVLGKLASDSRFCNSLIQLGRTAYVDVLRLQGQEQTELATAVTWRYRAAIAHIGLCGVSTGNRIILFGVDALGGADEEPGASIPSDLIKASSPVLIDGYLAYAASFAWYDVQRLGPSLGRTLETEFERLIDSNWKRISIMVTCIRVTCRNNVMLPFDLPVGCSGNPSTVLENLLVLLKKCNDPSCSAHTTSKKYLVHVFKFMGKAAIESSGQSAIGTGLIASLLRLSERFLRAQDCPAEFSPVARDLRRDLINALRSMCEDNMNTDHRNDGSGTMLEMDGAWFRDLRGGRMSVSREDSADMRNATLSDLMSGAKMPLSLSDVVYQLLLLFRELTGPDWLTISTNDDDLELVDLFSPVLQALDELPLGNRFKVRVRRLRREFEKFTSIVNEVAQSRGRDPNTGTDGVTGARDDD